MSTAEIMKYGGKRVPSAPNYFVTPNGDVYSLPNKDRFSVKKMGQFSDKDGYKLVKISLPTRRVARVHRLVAEAFIPNPENKPQVNHIDENKQNNHASNLEWATSKENNWHSLKTQYKNMRGSGSINSSGLTDEDVRDIRMFCVHKIPRKRIAEVYKISVATIHNMNKRLSWGHI